MDKFVRIFAIVFLATFAAGTAAHAASATEMSLKMTTSVMDDGGMADCQECPGDDGQTAACDQFCVTALIALCTPAGATFPDAADAVTVIPTSPHDGRTGPPEPYPPRTIHLS